MLDRVRAEVAEAYAQTHARFAQIGTTEAAVRSALERASARTSRGPKTPSGLPIELLDNLRLLADARYAYLDAIVDYNRAQFELYVALGQPPADALARPVPTGGIVLHRRGRSGIVAPATSRPTVGLPRLDSAAPTPPPPVQQRTIRQSDARSSRALSGM